MIQVLLRIAIWLIVLGIGYLMIGPQVFDSSGNASPFKSVSALYLPPPRSPRLAEYETLAQQRPLNPDEMADYRALDKSRNATFWQQQGISVESALADVTSQRRQHLVTLLQQGGATNEEIATFLLVAGRDHPDLLKDRQ